MENRIPRKGLKIYLLLIFIGIYFLPSLKNPCYAQTKVNANEYPALIQQADKALAAKDYGNALFLYEKAGRAKPELKYASGKMAEINATLEADPNMRAEIFENTILNAENFYKQKNYPEAKTEYRKAMLIDPTLEFPRERLAKISAVYMDPEDQAYFDDAVAKGDKAVANSEFEKSISFYEAALTVKPDAKGVKDKITNTRKQWADYKVRTEQSKKSIAAADKMLQAGKRTEARAEYQKALALFPENQYAKQKTLEIDNYDQNAKAIQANYDKSIEQADQFYINRDFASARLKYQEALNSKPEARYPKEMLEKTKTGEAQLQSDQQKYDAALANAENLLKSADYEAALMGFKSASAIKPAENYPKTKITEIEKLINDRASRKDSYEIAVKNGDQSLGEKKYDIALGYYKNALSLLPDEKYPTQKIEEITTITAKQKELDENYRISIAEADKQFEKNKFEEAISGYTKALELKPEESYPKQKITEAQAKLSDSKSEKEKYAAAIASGDRLLSESKYAEALEAYELSHNLRPFESYPISKIGEVNFLIKKQKSETEKYAKAIEQGDKALTAGNFDQATMSFQDALKIKPAEQYPQDKIAEIKAAVANQQQTDAKYAAALKSGDQLLAGKEYDRAKAAYTEAVVLKKNEKYPQDQIIKIDKIVSDLHSAEENYSQAITSGDNNFKNQKLTEAIASYKIATGIKPAETYPKSQIDKINALLGEQQKLEADYLASVTSADKLFTVKKYDEAIAGYRQALALKPAEKYPSDKISEAEKLIADQKTLKESYDKAIADGEKSLSGKDYTAALASFKTASGIKASEAYPKQKITEIQAILDKDKAEGQRYQEAIAQADKLFTDKKYSEALEPYQRASNIKPSEKYPQDQVAKINQLIADQKKIDADYLNMISDADAQLKSAKYAEARGLYADAGAIKPTEKLPKDKIAEIDGILASLQKKDQNYSKSVSDGDAFFAAKKYPEAIASFTGAASIKPSETYPKSQIDKINALLSEQKKLDADYLVSVSSADKLFTAKKYDEAIAGYRQALALKPAEKYPSDKISEAEKLIADQKTLQESYDKAIANGDKSLSGKDYTTALVSFKTASGIKTSEAYPKQKITEIQAILDKDKAEGQRYQEAIAQADKLFTDKKYSEALEPYQRASNIKPSEKYPKEQVAKINQLIADQKKLEADYQKLITDADAQLKSSKYAEARGSYSEASMLKPTEKLPKDKIAEIDGILTSIQKKDQDYSKSVSDGDAFFASKKYPEAIASYTNASTLKPSEIYPKTQIDKTNALIAEQKKLDDNFLEAITSADQFFDSKKYSEAITDYRKALALKPSEKYPTEKIAEAEKQLTDLKSKQEAYDKAIADGDKKLALKDYENALAAFKIANTTKPAETYPTQKITEIQAILDKAKTENESYVTAIATGDKFFTAEKYLEALEPYQRAGTIKPAEKYPQDQIARINQKLAGQKKLEDDYLKLITDAGTRFAAGKYNEARISYANAGTLKPAEKLPKDKIAEIDGILAGLKLKEENYTKAINTASDLYNAKNRTGAIKSYEEASLIKPAEKYPQERITSIKAEIKAIDDNYTKAVTLGDSKMASKNLAEALNAYQNALEIKPNEEYPKTKIAEINSALTAQKEELEKMYNSYIAQGDQLAGAKDYAGAKSAFTKASGIKPTETYPKQRITEITKITEEIELARRAEYNKAIGEADKLYNSKIFDQAIDAYEAAAVINPGDSYPAQQISKIRRLMSDNAILDLYSQTLTIKAGDEKKFNFSAIEPRLRKNDYILLKAHSTGKGTPKVYLNYGKDGLKNGGIVLRSLDKTAINDYLIRISVQDKWYREDNNWISLFVETGEIEITKVQIATGD